MEWNGSDRKSVGRRKYNRQRQPLRHRYAPGLLARKNGKVLISAVTVSHIVDGIVMGFLLRYYESQCGSRSKDKNDGCRNKGANLFEPAGRVCGRHCDEFKRKRQEQWNKCEREAYVSRLKQRQHEACDGDGKHDRNTRMLLARPTNHG